MPVNTLTIYLDRLSKTYQQGDTIKGYVVIENKYELRHEGLRVWLEGSVDIHSNLRTISFMDTFYGTKRTLTLLERSLELAPKGLLAPGRTEFAFKLLVEPSDERATLYETYHGVFVSIHYAVHCCLKRPLLVRDLSAQLEFTLEYADDEPMGASSASALLSPSLLPLLKPLSFDISPATLAIASTAANAQRVPEFRITGKLASRVCKLNEPIVGEFTVTRCSATIRSIELQLVRVETCCASANLPITTTTTATQNHKDYTCELTEIQSIQIAHGDPVRNVPLLIHMLLPRLFTCATLRTPTFKIEFELNLVVILEDNYLISETLPIELVRGSVQAASPSSNEFVRDE